MLIREINNTINKETSLRLDSVKSRAKIGVSDRGSSSFESSYNKRSKEDLNIKLKDIKDKGAKLSKTQTYMDALSYKKAIQSYLSEVLSYMYSLNKSESFWGNKYYSVISDIDSELYKITESLLKEEKDSIDVLKSIYKIEGMLVELSV